MGRLSRLFRSKAGFVLIYSLLFLCVTGALAALSAYYDRSMIWLVDGLSQQYVWFVYTGRWVRQLCQNIFVDHVFALPMWDFSAGFGSDIIESVSGVFVNPFYLLSALVPESATEFAFEASTIITIWIAGLTFSGWCLTKPGMGRGATLVGALTYVLAGNLCVAWVQQSFIPVLAVLPLILWGADRVFERKGVMLFVLSLAWTFAYSYYDAYMVAILLVIYCVFVFVTRCRDGQTSKPWPRSLALHVLAFVGLTCLAGLVSAVLLLPQALALVDMDRLSIDRSVSLIYSIKWYMRFVSGFTSHTTLGADAFVGFNIVVPFVIVLLVLRRRSFAHAKALLVGFVLLTAMMLLPAFGSVMNGFQYPADRWVYGYDLFISFVVARTLPYLRDLSRRDLRLIAVWVGAYLVLELFFYVVTTNKLYLITVVMLALMLAYLFALRPRTSHQGFMAFMAGAVAVSSTLSFVVFLMSAPYGDGQFEKQVPIGQAWEIFSENSSTGLALDLQEQGTYAVDQRLDATPSLGFDVQNAGFVSGVKSVNLYNSIYSADIQDFLDSVGVLTISFRYASLNSRAGLETLLGVKYFATVEDQQAMIPYGYDPTAVASGENRLGGNIYLFETDTTLPLAVVFHTAISTDDYDALSMLGRQESLMQALVLDGQDLADSGLTDASDDLAITEHEIGWSVAEANGCELVDNVIVVREAGATLTLSYEAEPNSESYLVMSDLTYEGARSHAKGHKDAASDNSLKDLVKNAISALDSVTESTPVESKIYFQSSYEWDYLPVLTPDQPTYVGSDDWAYNMGYSQEGGTRQITLTFDLAGRYETSQFCVRAVSLDGLDSQYQALADEPAEVTLGQNSITADVDVQEAGAVFFSVAYAPGWSATVDGEPATVRQADLGFMAVDVPAGSHQVQLTYTTPYLQLGAAFTALGLVLATAAALVEARFRRRRRAARANA